MDRFITARGSATPPAPPASGTANFPKSGTPNGEMPSIMGPYWHYMITESLRNVVVGGGKTPNHADHTLLLQAIEAIVAAAVAASPDASTTVKGRVQLADGPTAQGLTDATKAITAAALAAVLGAGGVSASDYVAIPFKDRTTGELRRLIIQWIQAPQMAPSSEVTLTFPVEFPNQCLLCPVVSRGVTTDVSSTGSQLVEIYCAAYDWNNAGVSIATLRLTGSNTDYVIPLVFAIGF